MGDAQDDEEPRSAPSTIEAAITIYEKLFSAPVIRKIIEGLEATYLSGSPFNSISKLLEIYYKCKTASKLEWFFRFSK